MMNMPFSVRPGSNCLANKAKNRSRFPSHREPARTMIVLAIERAGGRSIDPRPCEKANREEILVEKKQENKEKEQI